MFQRYGMTARPECNDLIALPLFMLALVQDHRFQPEREKSHLNRFLAQTGKKLAQGRGETVEQ